MDVLINIIKEDAEQSLQPDKHACHDSCLILSQESRQACLQVKRMLE